VKEFMPDVGFKLGTVGFRIFAAICSASMLLDDAGLAPDTDRAADVEFLPALSDREHVVMASSNAVNCSSVTK
jgi:hypothetical protein